MNKQRKTSHILNVFQYDPTTGIVTLPSSLIIPSPDSTENSTKVATTAWIREYVGSLGYATSAAVTSSLTNYLALTGGTLSGGIYINPTNTGVVGLDIASNTIRFRSDNLEGFKRQLVTTLSSGTLVKMLAAGYGGTYVTDLGFYTSSNAGENALPNIYLTGGNNYVGINTVTPQYNLDVAGTGRYTSTLIASSFVKSGGTSVQYLMADGSVSAGPSLAGYVPTSRTITINGTAYDLSADRAWSIASGVTSFNTRTGAITLTSGDVTGALGYTPYNSTNPSGYITASSLSSYLPLSGGTMTGALIVPAGDRGFEVNTSGGVSLYSNEINAGALGGTGDLYIGWRRTNTVHVGVNIHVGSQQGWDNPGGWNKNVLIDGTNHGRFRIKASNYTYGNIDVALWADSSVSPSHGISGSNATFAFNGSITSLTVGGQTVIHTGNIGSQSVNYASTAGTASNISAYTINQSLGTGNTPSFQEAIFGTTGGANNQGIQIRYQNYVSGYGRIRFYQSDSNHATIHVFSSSWQNGTLAGSSTGAINLDSGTGVTFGAWNNPDAYVVTGGQTYARGYRGIGNVAGTGEASYHPAGIYSTGNNWLYGNIMMNGYSISGANTISGSGLITGGTLRSNTNIYTDQNYGYGLVGVYTSTRYQGVFAMGDSYKLPADGSTTGSLYGLAWSHPNAGGVAGNLNTHGLLVMENGTFLAAISGSIRARDNVMAPAIYDSGSRVAISRGEGRQYVEYSRYVYNNGAYSGSGWIEPSDLGVRYAASSNYSNSTGSLSGFDKTNPSFGQVFASDWFRAQGDCGLYSQSYGGHLRRSNGSSFGNWETFGYERNGWSGFCYVHNYLLNIMSNTSGDHGFYQENGNGWTLFYNRGNNCWGIGTDNTYSGDGFRCVKYGSSQYGWTTWSDRRAKENISSITGALDTVRNMRGVYFNYISDEAKNKRVGFIAQELELVLPEAVRYAEEIDEYNVEYAQIVSVLTEAIKEQDAKMTAQEAKIQRLEQLVEQLINQ
jgi:hypothetical protein